MQALQIQNLTKKYKNGPEALKGISLTVEEGDFYGLLGPNGAGKSTTIGIIASLINKTSGSVKVFGHDIDTELSLAKSQIGIVPQEFNFNIFENPFDIVTNQAGFYGIPLQKAKEQAEYYLKKLSLWDKAFKPARTLSGGMKRRLMIARGMVHDPKLFILDEPTAGVDIEIRRSMWEFLQELNSQGKTIILTTHYLEEAEHLCRNIAIIDQGKIIEQDTVKDLINKLHIETIILDLKKPMVTLPEVPGFTLNKIDDLTLEASFTKEASLNNLFENLSKVGGTVTSMRNKANRLEELFLNLTTSSGGAAA